MEIKNTLQGTVNPYQTSVQGTRESVAARRITGQTGQGSQTVQGAGDRVSVSPEAILRTEAHKAISAAPDIRQEKVDAIKASIADGSYTIDSKNIAEKLLQSDALLAGTLQE